MNAKSEATPTEAAPTDAGTGRRRYNSTRRARQAAQTRQEVLESATALFAANGWAGTTIAAIAADADVAVETIYSGFRSKKNLLRAAMETAVVGDADEVALSDREEYQALARGTRAERTARAAQLTYAIHHRSAGVWRAILEAAPADEDIDGWRLELERGRREQLADGLELVTGRRLDDADLDMLWAVAGPEVFLKLTVDAGMDAAAYTSALARAFDRLSR